PGCKNTFTAGQRTRMRLTLQRIGTSEDPSRRRLLTSPGLQSQTRDVALDLRSSVEVICEGRTYYPSFLVENKGVDTITQLRFEVQHANAPFITEDWQGQLIPGEKKAVRLTRGVQIANQASRVNIRAVEVEGRVGDFNVSDNQIQVAVIAPGNRFPASPDLYCRTFNNALPPNDWEIGHLDTSSAFSIIPREDCAPESDYMMRHFRKGVPGSTQREVQRDFLVGPSFDLSNYGLVQLKLKAAYLGQEQMRDPKLRIWGAVCGETPILLYDKEATQISMVDTLLPAQTRESWIPSCQDWRPISIDLSQLSGRQVRIILEVEVDSSTVPNLFIDDICLNAEEACEPPKRIPNTPGTEYRADRTCFGMGGWIHYIKSAGPQTPYDLLLFSIKTTSLDAVSLAPEDVSMVLTTQYGQGGHDLSDSAAYADNAFGWHISGRYLKINGMEESEQPFLVRYYYDQQDIIDLWEATPALQGSGDFVIYNLSGKKNGDPWSGHQSISNEDYQEYFPEDSATLETWANQKFDNIFGATFLAKQLRVVGLGSGGDGQGMGAEYPVAFSPFEVTQVRSQMQISATLRRERGTEIVRLYRAREISPFEPGGFELLASREAQVDSEEAVTYSFEDLKPIEGRSYYFLEVSHSSGFVMRSDTLRAKYDPGKIVTLFPNPTAGPTKVLIDAKLGVEVRMQVLNASRQKLLAFDWTHDGSPVEVDLSPLPSGIFFYRVEYQGLGYWGKFIRVSQ
ncbi:MAG: hypothetical protein AAF804_00475, partial [Bacteroidota bacterium]